MSLLLTLYVHNKVRNLVDEAHEERAKNGPPLSLSDVLVITFLGQLMKKAQAKKQAAQQPKKKDTVS
jgi:hypothetical protein